MKSPEPDGSVVVNVPRGLRQDTGPRPEPGEARECRVVTTLLGEFGVSVGGAAIDPPRWKFKHPRLLWQMLCLAPGHRVSRDEAAEALWPQAGVQASSNRLYHALHTLRGIFSEAGVADARQFVHLQGGTLRLDAGVQLDLDLECFRQAVDSARACNGSDAAMAHLERARTIHRGALSLPAGAGEWFAPHQHALQRDRVWVLEQLAQRHRAAGRGDEALHACQDLVRAEPGNEGAHRTLIELYDAEGRSDLAVQQYTACSRCLRRDLGVEPSPATRQLVERIVAQANERASERVNARAADATGASAEQRYAAPQRATPLLGRQAELEELQRLLLQEDGARLITIVAAGGIGKTRLAAALTEHAQHHFADGVCFVTLGEVQRASLLAERVCQALGLSTAAQPADERLMSALAPQHRLLVLDRCEHLTNAAPLLTRWLQAAPRLHIVVTSQCALRSRAERVFELQPLSARAPQAAVALFASAAGLAGVEVDARCDEAAIRSVCERVGGNALAIELAAAQLPQVPLAAMAAALKAPLRMLAGASPDGELRHASLQATIAWSVSLLTPIEARLLGLASVFVMPFSAEDAQQVLGAMVDPASLQQGLRNLLERHLLSGSADLSDAGLKRFSMSDGVREFARAQAAADHGWPRVEAAHAKHFGSLAQRAWEWSDKGQLALARPLFVAAAAEIDLALQWMRQHGDVEVFLQRCWQYGCVQICFGAARASIELLQTAVSMPMQSDAERLYGARCNNRLSGALEFGGDLRAAMRAALRARQLASHLDDGDLDCRTAVRLARLLLMQRRVDRALVLVNQTLRKSQTRERTAARALLLWVQGDCFATRGQYAQAIATMERSIDCAHESQDPVATVGNLQGLACVAIEYGNLAQADQAVDEARLLNAVHLWAIEAFSVTMLSGILAFERRSFDEAARHFEEGLRKCQTNFPAMTLTAQLWQEFTLIETGRACDVTVLSNLPERELAQADHLTISCIHARAYRVALQAEQGRWAAVRLSIEHLQDYVRPSGNALWASVLAGGAAVAALCIGDRVLAQRLLDLAQWMPARIGVVPTPRQVASWSRLQARWDDTPDTIVSREGAALAPLIEQLSHDLPRWCGLTEDTASSQALRGERKTRGLPIAA
jgi:DNA-binding SARP family transcriptional activator/predicted ATPase